MTGPAIDAAALDEIEALLAAALEPMPSPTPTQDSRMDDMGAGRADDRARDHWKQRTSMATREFLAAAPVLIALARQGPEPVGEVTDEDRARALYEPTRGRRGYTWIGLSEEQREYWRKRSRAARLTPATDALGAFRDENEKLRAAVDYARMVFDDYEQLHFAKDTSDGYLKAAKNSEHSRVMRAALGQAK